MKTLTLSQVLVYCDGPQVIEARDSIGGYYIGIAIEHPEAEFLLVGANPERLRQFRGGTIDLLSLITDRPSDIGWQLAKFVNGVDNSLELSELSWESINPDYLPAAGFVLHGSSSAPDLVKQA